MPDVGTDFCTLIYFMHFMSKGLCSSGREEGGAGGGRGTAERVSSVGARCVGECAFGYASYLVES